MKLQLTLPILAVAALALSALLPSGCTNNSGLLQPPLPPIDTTVKVSFSMEVVPIFNESCNSGTCHSAGGIAPDLTAANAYDALWDGNYIDTIAPEQSELLQWMLGNRRLPMPLSGPNATYNETVLNWIAQGAQNN